MPYSERGPKTLSVLTSAGLSLQEDTSCVLVSVFSSSGVANTEIPLRRPTVLLI